MNLKQKIKELIANKNFTRAAIIYGGSLIIGIIGFFTLGTAGDYVLTCVPGLGSGIALAFLSNGHKEPVTVKSLLKSTAMIILITLVCWVIGIEIAAALIGAGLGLVGSLIGHWIMHLENKRHSSEPPPENSQIDPANS